MLHSSCNNKKQLTWKMFQMFDAKKFYEKMDHFLIHHKKIYELAIEMFNVKIALASEKVKDVFLGIKWKTL